MIKDAEIFAEARAAMRDEGIWCGFCHYQEGQKILPYAGYYRSPEREKFVQADECACCRRPLMEENK